MDDQVNKLAVPGAGVIVISRPARHDTICGMTTRQTTQEGFLRAGATLTRGGPIDYLRSEIGMTGDGMVTVNRTLETISHPATLASLRGAPITLGHPEGGVTPENFQDVVRLARWRANRELTGNAIIGGRVDCRQGCVATPK